MNVDQDLNARDNREGCDVLIVDASGEASEVIGTVLQRQGYAIVAARQEREGLQLVGRIRPKVTIVETSEWDRGGSADGAANESPQFASERFVAAKRTCEESERGRASHEWPKHFASASAASGGSIIFLGEAVAPDQWASSDEREATNSIRIQEVRKPFQYGSLIATIESLIKLVRD